MEKSFIAYIENSIKNNWDLDALTDYKGATLQYKDVARKIEKLHIIFEESGIRKGDKIAVCGRNSSHWGVTFLATLTYGAVIVPILHEFKADNVHNIVNHSEAKLLFVGDMVWENLNESAMPLLEGILMMNDFTLLVSRSERFGKNSFFQSKLCDSSKCKNPDQDQRNIYLIFQLASVLRRSYQDDQKNQNCNPQKNCTYGHLGTGQIFFCNTESICQILHIRSCKRCDTVEKKHTVYYSQKQP